MIRGSLVNLIYDRLLHLRHDGYDNGKAITLMSTDTDLVSDSAELFHELWGYILEVIIGMTMLSMEVSWLGGLTVILIFRKSRYT